MAGPISKGFCYKSKGKLPPTSQKVQSAEKKQVLDTKMTNFAAAERGSRCSIQLLLRHSSPAATITHLLPLESRWLKL